MQTQERNHEIENQDTNDICISRIDRRFVFDNAISLRGQ